ncbi:MAG: TetR/AcrR family transcriptional regulator [Actinomycetota bacterium]
MATRVKQKERTRTAIVDACERLLDRGVDPTIDDVAEEAGMSRATVYRYFDSPAMIVWHAMSDKATPSVEETFEPAGPELRDRVIAAERAINDYIFGNAHGVRRFQLGTIQRELDGTATPEDRPVRRLAFIDEALSTTLGDLPSATAHRLRYGLAIAIGAEALLATIDTCRLDEDDARDITRWVCDALVDRALADAQET